jgi:uncharacterized protein (DUF1697 family)
MKTYISLLRGINISGHKLIKMDALKTMYESLGFEKVRTYVQSGNVIFSAAKSNPEDLENAISAQIKEVFGFDVRVFVTDAHTLKSIIENNPFAKDPQKDAAFFHISFLSRSPEAFSMEAILSKKLPHEEIIITPNAIYLYCPKGYGETKLSTNFLEKVLNVSATTRNWRTGNELLKLANIS